VKAATAFSVS